MLVWYSLTGVVLLMATHVVAAPLEWYEQHDVRACEQGWEAIGGDPFVSTKLPTPVDRAAHCLLLDIRVSQASPLQIFWSDPMTPWKGECSATSFIPAADDYVTLAVNLNASGAFHGAHRVRIDVGNSAGVTFDVRRADLVPPAAVPPHLLDQLIGFHCFTSKLHFQAGEPIEYRVALNGDCYPDHASAKRLTLELLDAAGKTLATQDVQYGLRPGLRYKEIQGVLGAPPRLEPGAYTLRAVSRDLRSGRLLNTAHVFGVQGPDAPFVCETPFKFVKDFSIVRGPDGRWHVFSITGDFFENHDWVPDGQERTFSHASSPDLRRWTVHPPVLSISDAKYPDGREHYQNRNIWAPHVIKHDGKYWMFYTSVNTHVSQSISLATSEDLFQWTEYEHNPVLTLEDVDWADWGRTRWADCRDACVLVDGDRFYLYATAAAKPPGERGAVVVAESENLLHWRNPRIAVRRGVASESPQVWKDGDVYCMTTSSTGAATYVSDHPATGWRPVDFPRPDTPTVEKYVPTSACYAEEVVRAPDGALMMAGLTWRHWGNSIYFFRIKSENGIPIAYESPWRLGAQPAQVEQSNR